MKSPAQQHRNGDYASVSGIGQVVDHLIDAGLGEIEERDADVQIRSPSTQGVDGAENRGA